MRFRNQKSTVRLPLDRIRFFRAVAVVVRPDDRIRDLDCPTGEREPADAATGAVGAGGGFWSSGDTWEGKLRTCVRNRYDYPKNVGPFHHYVPVAQRDIRAGSFILNLF